MQKDIRAFLRRAGSASVKRMEENVQMIHRETGVSKAFIRADMLACTAQYGIGYLDYRVFGFAENRDRENRKTYMTLNHNSLLSKKLNERSFVELFADKFRFNLCFRPYLGRKYLELNHCTEDDFTDFCSGRESVFAKVANSFGGQGIEKLLLTDETDLHREYERLLAEKKFLVEETIIQHENMKRLCPESVNTLRIVTVLKDGKAHFVYGLLRMGNGKNSFDNITSGGMYALIDQDGHVSPRAFCDKTTSYYECHPTSGIRFAEFSIPYYEQAVALCLQAALTEPHIGYVGWDVAITPKGPVLVEGNHLPSYTLCQNHGLNGSKTGYLPVFENILGSDFFCITHRSFYNRKPPFSLLAKRSV